MRRTPHSPGRARKLEDLVGAVRQIQTIAEHLRRPLLADILRRGEESAEPDGYPPRSGGANPIGSHGASESTSTEHAALWHFPTTGPDVVIKRDGKQWVERPIADPVGDAVEKAEANIYEASGLLASAARLIDGILNMQAEYAQRHLSIDICGRCQRTVKRTPNDRLRSNYCNSCYTAWLRAGRPDRLRFEGEIMARSPTTPR